MTTYIIASKPNDPKLGDCQVLGDFIDGAAQDVCVKYVFKDASEWPAFIDSVCRGYGFVGQKPCPIVYTL